MTKTIRYRPGWRQLPWPLLVWPGYNLVRAFLDDPDPVLTGVAALVLVLAATSMGAFLRYTGVELRPDALVMYGLRTRVVPWHEITWIGPRRLFGTHYIGVLTGGRIWNLRAPVHTAFLAPDPEFGQKAETIYAWWLALRGPDWQPPPHWGAPGTDAATVAPAQAGFQQER